MKKAFVLFAAGLVLILMGAFIIGGIYKDLSKSEQIVREAWQRVQNAHQRRMEMIYELSQIVKNYARHEREAFALQQARAKSADVLSMDVAQDARRFKQFNESQKFLDTAFLRLMELSEKYPQLNSDSAFLEIRAQIDGAESRIAIERQRFNQAAQAFNLHFRRYPRIVAGTLLRFKLKETFKEEATRQFQRQST